MADVKNRIDRYASRRVALWVLWSFLGVLLACAQVQSAPKRVLLQEDASIVNPLQYGSALDSTTMNAAITAIGANNRVLMLTEGTWTISANVTVPRNITLFVPQGARVTINNGITLTLNGPYDFHDPAWYTGLGTLTVNYRQEPLNNSFVLSDCVPSVPVSSLTFAAFACNAFVSASNLLMPVRQAAAAVTLANTDGVHWIAACRDTDSPVSGWTRTSGTHYVHRQTATEPAEPTGCMLITRAVVASGIINKVTRLFSTRPTRELGIQNIKDYGAVGENSTHDDGIPFQRAITAACAQTYGGVVYVPPGLYRIYTAAEINCSGKGMTIRGDGLPSALLGYATGRILLISTDDVLIEKISFQGTSTTTILIDVNDDGSGGNFRLLASWLSGGTTYGVKLSNSIVPYIAGNVISSIQSGAYGIWCAGGTCNGATIIGNRFDGVAGNETGRRGMYITNANTVTIHGNVIEALEIGIELDGGRGFSIMSNYFESNCRSITSINSQNIAASVENNTFGTAPACGVVDIDLSNSLAWKVKHNYSANNFGYGANIRITAGGVTGSEFGPNSFASAAEVGPAGAVTPTNTYCSTSGICIRGTLSTSGLGQSDFAVGDELRVGANALPDGGGPGTITIYSGNTTSGFSDGFIPFLLNDGTRVWVPYIVDPTP